MKCQIAFEVSRTSGSKTRSVVFTQRRAAQKFKGANVGSTLHVVELCTTSGKIKRRGKRAF